MQLSLLQQLRRILDAMQKSGRRPMRIYCTYAQLMAIRDELQIKYCKSIEKEMELYGVPIQLTKAGSGLWVSCMSNQEEKQ